MSDGPRTIPNKIDTVLADVIKIWTETNPEACRQLEKWNKKLDNFLFKSKNEQSKILKKMPKSVFLKLNQLHIEKQVNLLRQTGMLPKRDTI
jgi:hypothetical protein